jgi:uncharacterized protein (TIGR00251 family)
MTSVRIAVRVTPRAGQDRIDGMREGVLHVRLTAPPVEGQANEALVRLLAHALGVPPRAVRVLRGHTGREKLLEIVGLDTAAVERRWGAGLPGRGG